MINIITKSLKNYLTNLYQIKLIIFIWIATSLIIIIFSQIFTFISFRQNNFLTTNIITQTKLENFIKISTKSENTKDHTHFYQKHIIQTNNNDKKLEENTISILITHNEIVDKNQIIQEFVYLNVPSRKQERNLSCEYQSAADLAAYYGWNISWQDIFLKVGPDPSGDPNRGFAGRSLDDPPGSLFPFGYGIYAEPLARGLRRLGIQAQAHSGKDVAWLKARLSQGHPVVVWATYGMTIQPISQWLTAHGTIVEAVPYEHTFTVIGYNQEGVWVNDPYDASQKFYSWQVFGESWNLLSRMALTIDEKVPIHKNFR
ncbi:MAG: C39 family peptidase [Candidatus Methanomethylicaceae archaeon]